MSKGKRRPNRHGTRPSGRRGSHLSAVPDANGPGTQDAPPELLGTLRRSLRSEEPLDLLLTVSTMLHVAGPPSTPLAYDDAPQVDLGALVDSFIGVDYAETTAVLAVMQVLVDDEALRARMQAALAKRRQPMPAWIHDLSQARIQPQVSLMTDVLGDGDNYLVGLQLRDGRYLTALIYVDVNLGGVVKDAFVIPEAPESIEQRFAEIGHAEGEILSTADPAQARAIIEEAITFGSAMYPPLQSDTWPACQPLVEWMLRMLPAGGVAPPVREWSEKELSRITEDFMASPYAVHLDEPDHADLMDPILWFASGWSGTDPFRWSPVRVEILLSDWFPRKVVADAEYLSKMPTVLRAYIRYCQNRVGVPSSRTQETLLAVDEWEPQYQRTIRSERLQGPAALIASMMPGFAGSMDGAFDDDIDGDIDGDIDDYLDDASYAEIMLEHLDRCVGGRLALMRLDATPLPDEPFTWAGIPDDIHPVVEQVLEDCDRVAGELFEVEFRTAARRLLGRIAVGDPAIFRRKASPTRGAAAVAWLVMRANQVGYGTQTQALLGAFGITGSVSQRAEPMLRAIGINPYSRYGSSHLGAADLLTSGKRASIITARDRLLAMTQE